MCIHTILLPEQLLCAQAKLQGRSSSCFCKEANPAAGGEACNQLFRSSDLKYKSTLDKVLIILLMLPCSKFMAPFLLWNSELTRLYNKVIRKQYFHFLCSFQVDSVRSNALGRCLLMYTFLNNLERGWYLFRMSYIVFVWVLKNYVCINQKIR